jgi:hypothetical protein
MTGMDMSVMDPKDGIRRLTQEELLESARNKEKAVFTNLSPGSYKSRIFQQLSQLLTLLNTSLLHLYYGPLLFGSVYPLNSLAMNYFPPCFIHRLPYCSYG